ncbi:MAG: HAMP domain-containing sensor histidine kinase, partial [Pseudomonadota bacterium]
IRVLLSADAATRAGDEQHEVIPPERIPLDELGEIMRSHNETVTALRSNERQLAAALGEIERVAADLKTKNDLLEAARRNLADTDRLASLGMMSAGIAHEINTPLTVVSGLTQRLSGGATLSESEAGLLRRVIARLERLAESLLDYARVRPAIASRTALEPLVHEAFTLVSLDRNADQGRLDAELVPGLAVNGDPDRLLQVLVNLARNGLDAMGPNGRLLVTGDRVRLEGADWVRLRVVDDGPGIDPRHHDKVFLPFRKVKSREHAPGSGIGLALVKKTVEDMGGSITLASDPSERPGASFVVSLPADLLA